MSTSSNVAVAVPYGAFPGQLSGSKQSPLASHYHMNPAALGLGTAGRLRGGDASGVPAYEPLRFHIASDAMDDMARNLDSYSRGLGQPATAWGGLNHLHSEPASPPSSSGACCGACETCGGHGHAHGHRGKLGPDGSMPANAEAPPSAAAPVASACEESEDDDNGGGMKHVGSFSDQVQLLKASFSANSLNAMDSNGANVVADSSSDVPPSPGKSPMLVPVFASSGGLASSLSLAHHSGSAAPRFERLSAEHNLVVSSDSSIPSGTAVAGFLDHFPDSRKELRRRSHTTVQAGRSSIEALAPQSSSRAGGDSRRASHDRTSLDHKASGDRRLSGEVRRQSSNLRRPSAEWRRTSSEHVHGAAGSAVAEKPAARRSVDAPQAHDVRFDGRVDYYQSSLYAVPEASSSGAARRSHDAGAGAAAARHAPPPPTGHAGTRHPSGDGAAYGVPASALGVTTAGSRPLQLSDSDGDDADGDDPKDLFAPLIGQSLRAMGSSGLRRGPGSCSSQGSGYSGRSRQYSVDGEAEARHSESLDWLPHSGYSVDMSIRFAHTLLLFLLLLLLLSAGLPAAFPCSADDHQCMCRNAVRVTAAAVRGSYSPLAALLCALF